MEKETSPPSVFSYWDFYINQESLIHRRLKLVFLYRNFLNLNLLLSFKKQQQVHV